MRKTTKQKSTTCYKKLLINTVLIGSLFLCPTATEADPIKIVQLSTYQKIAHQVEMVNDALTKDRKSILLSNECIVEANQSDDPFVLEKKKQDLQKTVVTDRESAPELSSRSMGLEDNRVVYDYGLIDTKYTTSTSVNSNSGASLEELIYLLTTYYPNFKDPVSLAKGLYINDMKHGVNAYFSLSVACLESSCGNSRLAKNKNNIFSIRAYDKDPYKNARTYDTQAECVAAFKELMYGQYYFNKGKTTTGEINTPYASDTAWASKVTSLMNKNQLYVDQYRDSQ